MGTSSALSRYDFATWVSLLGEAAAGSAVTLYTVPDNMALIITSVNASIVHGSSGGSLVLTVTRATITRVLWDAAPSSSSVPITPPQTPVVLMFGDELQLAAVGADFDVVVSGFLLPQNRNSVP